MRQILYENSPHLFLITETQMRSNTGINIEGYTLFSRKRECKTGGGVAVLVRNDIRSNITAHISDRDIEIIWVSVRRKNTVPLMIGTYYGKQESRTSKAEIEREMTLLSEEILEMKNDGVIMIAMDGNAKIGILGEEISRNGRELLKALNDLDITIMNGTDKCIGAVTRVNTKNDEEKSAIDFIAASEEVCKWIQNIKIDEDGLNKVIGKNNSDHNTISISIKIPYILKMTIPKRTGWNIKADDAKWEKFTEEIRKRKAKATEIITNPDVPMDVKYKKYVNEIERAAMNSIGKTTFKNRPKVRLSDAIKNLQQQKKILKKQIQAEKDKIQRDVLISNYKDIQHKILNEMTQEKVEELSEKIEKITADSSKNALWGIKRHFSRDPTLECLSIKNDQGIRLYDPEGYKEQHAHYFESLYKAKQFTYHPYHTEVLTKIDQYTNDRDYEDTTYNRIPTKQELADVIRSKKNGKSTPDFRNEMLKRTGEPMIDFLHPLIVTIFKDEDIPTIEFNKGLITCLYKGKGDKENLCNHRGITTSSTIGTIIETMIDNRIAHLVPYTQAQGGGKKGASCADHLFILRAIIDISIKEKRSTFITFYDVSKAYDNVDNNDLLVTM